MTAPGDFHSQRLVFARRKHLCWWSGKEILPGTAYIRMTGKFEGSMYSEPLHKDHETIVDAVDQKPEILRNKGSTQ